MTYDVLYDVYTARVILYVVTCTYTHRRRNLQHFSDVDYFENKKKVHQNPISIRHYSRTTRHDNNIMCTALAHSTDVIQYRDEGPRPAGGCIAIVLFISTISGSLGRALNRGCARNANNGPRWELDCDTSSSRDECGVKKK